MKKYELTEQFILEAHKAACEDWKRKIEKEVPELFTLRKGSFVKSSKTKTIVFITEWGEDSTFSGVVLVDTGAGYKKGHYSTNWSKESFEPIKAELKIE